MEFFWAPISFSGGGCSHISIYLMEKERMCDDLKKIKGGASDAGARDEMIKGFCDSDGQISAYADLSATLRINMGQNDSGYSVLLADQVLFEGEMTEKIWAILDCHYPRLAEMIRLLRPKEENANE